MGWVEAFMPNPQLCLAAALTGLLVLTGCGRREIQSYRVPKELPAAAPTASPAAMNAGTMPALPTDPHAPAAPRWTVPPTWSAQPAAGSRVGSFTIKADDGRSAELAVTTFPGDVGGDLANVNRWRQQLGLNGIAESDLGAAVQTLDAPAGKFLWVDLVGDQPAAAGTPRPRMLSAWLKQEGRTWFFKMTGEDALVAAQREAFTDFLKSVVFAPPGTAPAAPVQTAQAPKESEEKAKASAPAEGASVKSSDGKLSWTPAAGWTAKPLGQMRRGSFAVRSPDGREADLSITSFAGAAGGLEANLNRWRDQVKLPAQDAATLAREATELSAGELKFTVVDYAGQSANGATRIVGAVLPFRGESYFFKLMGPDDVVLAQKPAFLAFLQSVKPQ